ncbi:MAG: protease inhibitor I42 family protein [Thermoleophilia bacterium]|nr:protease inhibitor I42 family protein [Thermoleophilia bacterium]
MTGRRTMAALAVLGATTTLGLAGCGGSDDAGTTAASAPVTTAPELPPGAPSAPVGGILTVQLEANPTTGYEWKVDAVPAGLRLVSQTYRPDRPVRVGSGGTTSFRFRGVEPGVYRLAFTYRRPFAPDDAPSRQTVGVRVTP